MSALRSATGARLAVLLALSLGSVSAVAAEPAARAAGEHDLYLEVIVNGAPTGLIGAFRRRPDGRLAATREELRELGLDAAALPLGPDGLVALDDLAVCDYDEAAQTVRIAVGDEGRVTRTYSAGAGPGLRTTMREPAESGAVLNYTLYATTDTDLHGFLELEGRESAVSGLFDGWIYGAWGTFSQSATVSTGSGKAYDSVRLDTRWSYSDPGTLTTYRAGDVISGGLSWSRPVRLGGVQVERDFALRPDLVTMPVPTLSGSAAVPSTVEVYANNVRVFSREVPSGPFEISNIPVMTGAGTAELVIHDSLGRDTVADVSFYATPRLLKGGLYDFSVEAGFPRQYYGTLSNAYDERPALSATMRYGLWDALTLEAHGEASEGLLNAGAGVVFPVGSFGVVAMGAAASRSDGTGALLAGSAELAWGPLAFHARSQRALGDYEDIASVSAPVRGDLALRDNEPFRSLDQAAVSASLPFDPSTVTLSFTRLGYAEDEYRIAGISVSRRIFDTASLFVSASKDFGGDGGAGLFYAGLSVPLGPRLSAGLGASAHGGEHTGGIDVARSETAGPGSYGWRLRDREGAMPERMVAASYRAAGARVAARVQQFGDDVSASGEVEGAIALADGHLFLSTPITGAFAVVDAGVPDIAVFRENRPVGRTDASGRLLVPDLVPHQANTISIDPVGLPVDAEIVETKQSVVVGARSGGTARFPVVAGAQSAVLVLSDRHGTFLPPGLRASLDGQDGSYVVGYDGEVFVRGLALANTITVELPRGGACRAAFPFAPRPGEQVVIPLTCD